MAEINANTHTRMETGKVVGEAARNILPGGVLIEYNKDPQVMADQTRKLIDNGCTIIYEATFIYKDLIAMCDILMVTRNGVVIFEVKSATEVKDEYIDDVAFQEYVISKCRFTVDQANIIYINTYYVRNGKLEYDKLFTIADITEKIDERRNIININEDLGVINAILKYDMPKTHIGKQCKKPNECDYCKACWEHIPDYSVFNLYRVSDKAYSYYEDGIITLNDIHESGIPLKGIQKLQVDTLLSGEPVINKVAIKKFIDNLKYPLYYLDFETFQEAIPSHDGIRPYEQVPFQYSLHIQHEANGEQVHKEFLGKEGTNPKRALAEQICQDIGLAGTVLAYNMSFEGTVLKKLAEEYPDLADHLLTIASNLDDLLIPFRETWYYTKEMKGSFSIKSVLPALYPPEAMAAFPRMATMTAEEVDETRRNLLKYCGLDTYAMVKVLDKLREVAE